jgi:hypothetical protein
VGFIPGVRGIFDNDFVDLHGFIVIATKVSLFPGGCALRRTREVEEESLKGESFS